MPASKLTTKQRIEKLIEDANRFESKAAKFTDMATRKRRIAAKLQSDADEAATR